MRRSLALVLIAVAFAGCVGHSSVKETVVTNSSSGTDARVLGELHGTVLDESTLPLAGVSVMAIGKNSTSHSTTNGVGVWSIPGLDPGTYNVAFNLPDYAPALRHVAVQGNARTPLDVNLTLLPEFRASNYTFTWQGHYDCAAEALIATGDCGFVYGYVFDNESDPVTQEDNADVFSVEPRWSEVIVELTWQGAQDYVDGMHVYLSPGDNPNPSDEHPKYATAEGSQQPLKIDLVQGVAGAGADNINGTKLLLGPDGGPALLLVYPRGKGADTAGQVCEPPELGDTRCFLGAGAATDLEVTAYVTLFYNERAPAGFTGIPPA